MTPPTDELLAELRSRVDARLLALESATNTIQSAITRVEVNVEALRHWQVTEQQRRDTQLDQSPDIMRNVIGTYGGCIGQIVYTTISLLSLALAIAAIIITLRH